MRLFSEGRQGDEVLGALVDGTRGDAARAKLCWRTFDDYVGVGTSVAERAHADSPARKRWERAQFRHHIDIPFLQSDLGIQLADTDGGRDQAVFEHQRGIDNAGNAAGSIGVAQVGLD